MTKYCLLMPLFMFVSCTSLPQLYQAAEDIANDDAIDIMVSREALQKDTNLKMNIEVTNTATSK